MNPIMHALQRALTRRTDANLPPIINVAPIPVTAAEPIRIVEIVDTIAYSIGPYAGDPRITAIGAQQVYLDDGRCFRRIQQPDWRHDLYPGFAAPRVWRMFRPDLTSSAFWWPDLADALADVLGPPLTPRFIPGAALAALSPDSPLLPSETS